MKSKILGLLAVGPGLLAGPMMANATAITWAFQSTVTGFTVDPGDDLVLQIGDSFGFHVTFSDAAPLSGCSDQLVGDPNPDRCDYVDATLVFSDLRINGALIGDPTFQPQPPSGPTSCGRNQNGSITVRNNGLDPAFGDSVDGISFGRSICDGADILESYSVVIRGPVLDIFNDLSIPTNPDPRLAGLRITSFEACVGPVRDRVCTSYLSADIDSVSRVPEPGTLALLGLGLAGLGLTRRPKTATATRG